MIPLRIVRHVGAAGLLLALAATAGVLTEAIVRALLVVFHMPQIPPDGAGIVASLVAVLIVLSFVFVVTLD